MVFQPRSFPSTRLSCPSPMAQWLDGISPQVLKDLTVKSNGQTGLNYLGALTNLVNVTLEGKVPFEHRPYFFGAKLIALKTPDGGLRPIAVGNTFKMRRIACLRQVGVGTKRGAELASHVFHCLIESLLHEENVILKIDFENACNSINRHFNLEKTFEVHPEVYKYSNSAYSQPSFLFYGDSVIKT